MVFLHWLFVALVVLGEHFHEASTRRLVCCDQSACFVVSGTWSLLAIDSEVQECVSVSQPVSKYLDLWVFSFWPHQYLGARVLPDFPSAQLWSSARSFSLQRLCCVWGVVLRLSRHSWNSLHALWSSSWHLSIVCFSLRQGYYRRWRVGFVVQFS